MQVMVPEISGCPFAKVSLSSGVLVSWFPCVLFSLCPGVPVNYFVKFLMCHLWKKYENLYHLGK